MPRRSHLMLVCSLNCVLAGVAAAQQGPDSQAAQSPAERRIVERTNAYRDRQGLGRLAVDPELTAAASYFARFMAETGEYGHTADGQRPGQRAEQQGYDYCLVAENIGFYESTRGIAAGELAALLVEGWIDSPEHRRNLLDPDVTQIGVGVSQSDETGRYYAVQLFGRPRSQAIEVTIANRSDEPVEYQLGDQTYEIDKRVVRVHKLCRPAPLSLATDKEQSSPAIEVASGDRFVVVSDDEGEPVIRKSPAKGSPGQRTSIR